jgi:hypothetical protein
LGDQDLDYGYKLLVILFLPIIRSTEIKPGKQKCLGSGTALTTGLGIEFYGGSIRILLPKMDQLLIQLHENGRNAAI